MSRPAPVLFGILAVATFTIAACGSDGTEAGVADREVPDAGDGSGLPEPPEGAVAVVDGKEISEETFEELYEKVLAIPAVAEQLRGAQGEASEPMLQAQVLSQMLVSEVLFSGAKEDFDIEVSAEEVRAQLEEMQDQAGGEDEFGQQIQGMGTTKEMLVDQDLPFALMVEQVQEQVAGDEAETTPPPAPPGQQQAPSAAQLAFQEWAQDKLAAASVSVRSQIGVWNPNTGQVQPPGGVSGGPGGQPQPGR